MIDLATMYDWFVVNGVFEWQIREWSIDHYGLDPLGGLMMKDKSRSELGKVDALNSGVITHATFAFFWLRTILLGRKKNNLWRERDHH